MKTIKKKPSPVPFTTWRRGIQEQSGQGKAERAAEINRTGQEILFFDFGPQKFHKKM